MKNEKDILMIMKRIDDHEVRITRVENLLIGEKVTRKERKKETLGEFIKRIKPTSEIMTTLLIGYFLEIINLITPFTKAEIETGYKNAHLTPPDNISLSITNNVRKACFEEYPEKKDGTKAWTLTNTGIELVEKIIAEKKTHVQKRNK